MAILFCGVGSAVQIPWERAVFEGAANTCCMIVRLRKKLRDASEAASMASSFFESSALLFLSVSCVKAAAHHFDSKKGFTFPIFETWQSPYVASLRRFPC